jgi:hypothetical protein
MLPHASGTLTWSFVALAVLLAGALVAACYWVERRDGRRARAARARAAVVAALSAGWLALTAGAAATGQLRFGGGPPTALLLLALAVGGTFALGLSALGARLAAGLPLSVLVGFHGFRVAVELLLDRAYQEGLAPVQLTYRGRNFDIVTGVTALALAALLASGRLPRRLVSRVVGGWNAMGAVLLLNVVGVAVLSAPTPLRMFHNEPANVWVTRAPWVWLPTVMVVAAILGHVLVYRRLRGPAGGLVPAAPEALSTPPGHTRHETPARGDVAK